MPGMHAGKMAAGIAPRLNEIDAAATPTPVRLLLAPGSDYFFIGCVVCIPSIAQKNFPNRFVSGQT